MPQQKQSMSAGKIVLIILAVLMGGSILTCGMCTTCMAIGANEMEKEKELKEKGIDPDTGEKESVISTSPEELLSMYEDNEIGADNKFKGNLVRMSGRIDNIGKDILDQPYLTIEAGTGFSSVQCFLRSDQTGTAGSLSSGQSVTIEGRVEGKMMNVIIKGCSVE